MFVDATASPQKEDPESECEDILEIDLDEGDELWAELVEKEAAAEPPKKSTSSIPIALETAVIDRPVIDSIMPKSGYLIF